MRKTHVLKITSPGILNNYISIEKNPLVIENFTIYCINDIIK